jgi:hypothetical protein
MKRVCLKCKVPKELSEFPKDKTKPWYGGYDCYCKECKRTKVRKHYKENKDHKIAKVRKWQEENPEKYKKQQLKQRDSKTLKLWKENNQDKIQQYKETNIKKRKLKRLKEGVYYKDGEWVKVKPKMTKIERRIASTFRDKIRRAIQLDRKSSFEILGCSFQELKYWLEKQFIEGMSWDNYGKVWEIDHKQGCATFDLTIEENQKKCFHYTNLRPLFKTTEIAKQFGSNQVGNRNRSKRGH